MTVVLFEDQQVSRLGPVTLGRPAMCVACGGYRLLDLAGRCGRPLRAVVRPHLRGVVAAEPARLLLDRDPGDDLLLVNARLVPQAGIVQRLAQFARAAQPAVLRAGEAIAAAWLPARGVGATLPGLAAGTDPASLLAPLDVEQRPADLPLLDYPHDLIRYHPAALRENLDDRLAGGGYRELAAGVFAADDVRLGPYVATDAEQGPIVLEAGVEVGALASLHGPLWLGRESRVADHAQIRLAVAAGQSVRLGGEVSCSIIEAYSNKQHYGFLGHSYLGSWVNVGAGTSNSNLKNTYGEVTAQYADGRRATGLRFFGCVLGDYAKTAINTSIFTGKMVGPGSMLYGAVTANVPSFVNYAAALGQVTAIAPEVLVQMQARMFARRGLPQRPCDVQLLLAMYELTAAERDGLPVAPPRF